MIVYGTTQRVAHQEVEFLVLFSHIHRVGRRQGNAQQEIQSGPHPWSL